jgi:hypothetical protein
MSMDLPPPEPQYAQVEKVERERKFAEEQARRRKKEEEDRRKHVDATNADKNRSAEHRRR